MTKKNEKIFENKYLKKNSFKYKRKLIKKSIQYHNNINLILFIKSFLYILLFKLCLSKTIRKLISPPPIINITIVGQGSINILSNNSQLNLKNVHFDDEIIQNYKLRTIKFVSNQPFYNMGLELDLNNLETISFKSLFENMYYLTRVDLSNFNKKVNDMSNMFKNCKTLEYVNFGDFDTSAVTTMEYMFYNTNLTFVDLSKFDTSSVNSMKSMFGESKNLMILNLMNFKTLDVTNMKKMFYNCKSLIFLNLYSFQENINLQINAIFNGTKDDLIYCVNENYSKIIKNELNGKTTTNNCQHDCFQGSKRLIPIKKQCLNNCIDDEEGIYIFENF